MADIVDLREKAKNLWMKGVNAVGNAAAGLADSTRLMMDKADLQNRRKDALSRLSNEAYALWLEGKAFPEPMEKILTELKQLDEQLREIRADQKPASVTDPGTEETASSGLMTAAKTENPPETESEELLAAPSGDQPETTSIESFQEGSDVRSVRSEINELFDDADAVSKTSEKINTSLEQLSERIRDFSKSEGENDSQQRQE